MTDHAVGLVINLFGVLIVICLVRAAVIGIGWLLAVIWVTWKDYHDAE